MKRQRRSLCQGHLCFLTSFQIHNHFLFYNVYLFLEREKENRHEQGRGRDNGREGIPRRLYADSAEPDAGLHLTVCEIMT